MTIKVTIHKKCNKLSKLSYFSKVARSQQNSVHLQQSINKQSQSDFSETHLQTEKGFNLWKMEIKEIVRY